MSKKNNAVVASVKNDKSVKTDDVKKVSKKTPRDAFGNRLATRSHVINHAIFTRKNKSFTCAEITADVNADDNATTQAYLKMSGKDEIGAIRNHLLFLVANEHLSFDDESATYSVVKTSKSKK